MHKVVRGLSKRILHQLNVIQHLGQALLFSLVGFPQPAFLPVYAIDLILSIPIGLLI